MNVFSRIFFFLACFGLVALGLCQDGLSEKAAGFEDELLNATTNEEKGLIYHEYAKLYDPSNLDTALILAKKALALKEESIETNPLSYQKTVFNIGSFHRRNEQPNKALEAYAKLIQQGFSSYLVGRAYNETGYIQYSSGKFEEAILSYKAAIPYFENTERKAELTSRSYNNIASAWAEMRKVEEIPLVKQYLAYARNNQEVQQARSIQLNLGRLLESAEMHEESLDTYSAIPYSDVDDITFKAYINIGIIYLEHYGNLKAAKEWFLKAEQEAYTDEELASVYNNLAEIDLSEGLLEQAINKYNTDIDLLENSASAKHFLAKAFGDRGRAYVANNDLSMAIADFKRSDSIIQDLRLRQTALSTKTFWREEAKPIYNNALRALFNTKNPQLFTWMEKSKAVILFDDLQRYNVAEQNQAVNSLLSQEREINARLKTLKEQGSNPEIQKEIGNLQVQLEQLTAQLVQQQLSEKPLTKQAVLQRLSPNETLINFVWADSLLYRYSLSKQHAEVKQIATSQLTPAIQAWVQYLLNPPETISQQQDGNSLSATIYNALFQDLALANTTELIILPDGLLNFIPFEALQDSDGKYLLQHVGIRYGYSASTYFAEKASPVGKSRMAFAPIQYNNELPALRASLNEVEQFRPNQKLYNDAATLSNLIRATEEAYVLHVSSHASAADAEPWIATVNDKLYLSSLYNLRSRANLVVLSACETTLGEEVKGEGVMSLARAFFKAGANSVIASLWQVNEASTAEILNSFYAYTNKGIPKAEALRKAKLDFMEQNPERANLPYYWAGLTYYGENTKLNNSGKTWPVWAFGLITVLFLIWRRRSS